MRANGRRVRAPGRIVGAFVPPRTSCDAVQLRAEPALFSYVHTFQGGRAFPGVRSAGGCWALPRLVVPPASLREFHLVAVGVVGRHGPLPRRVVGRLGEGDAARLHLRVEGVKVVRGELDV